MRAKTESELKWAEILDAARTAIRLKYRLRANAELNEYLPELEADYLAALKEGRAFEFDTASVLREVDDEG